MRTTEPAWLVAAVDQRLALLKELVPGDVIAMFDTIFLPLNEPAPDATPEQRAAWEHTCDRCGKHDPSNFSTGHVERTLDNGKHAIVAFGVCSDCVPSDN